MDKGHIVCAVRRKTCGCTTLIQNIFGAWRCSRKEASSSGLCVPVGFCVLDHFSASEQSGVFLSTWIVAAFEYVFHL